MSTIAIEPGKVSLATWRRVHDDAVSIQLSLTCRNAVEAAQRLVLDVAAGDAPVYGINTGFGKLANIRIAPEDTAVLQRNLILSHAAGVGPALPVEVVRLILALKLNSLARGASGVSWELLTCLQAMLARDLLPVVPAQGSVGASGDLAPLAHVAAVMIGEGEADFQGQRLSGQEAMAAAGIAPIELGPKEGLAMINGTQVSTALALAALFRTFDLFRAALVTGALSTDAAMGSAAPFRPELQELRGLPGQIDAAGCLRDLMDGSEIRESHRENDERVQDPYCIRCQPQVMGAALDILRQAAHTLGTEANAVTDNPLVFPDSGAILSGGNFHAEPVAFTADQMALAIAEIGSIAERRIALLIDPALNFGLPAFLTPKPGLNSGFMIAEVTAAALYAENKQMAGPCSVDSTPTSANQEDHVSMAAHAARRLLQMNRNLARILGIELMMAAQGVEMRAPLKTSPALQNAITRLRQDIPPLEEDRYLSTELRHAAVLIENRDIIRAAGADKIRLVDTEPRS